MTEPGVTRLLDRFMADVSAAVPLVALWAHGSLAFGDFQPGRSDLDLVALVGTEPTDAQRERLRALHQRLFAEAPFADKLHCTYLPRQDAADAGRSHPTWALGEWFERPVSPVGRRELTTGALVLTGPSPVGELPGVSDAELTDFIRRDLRDYWLPVTAKPELWVHDAWVDAAMLTFARASVTLRDGRLVTKREALDELRAQGAPAAVVEDIHRRRYGTADGPGTEEWLHRRGELARAFVRAGIEATTESPVSPHRPPEPA
ncbi:hypothetical protein ACFRMN_11735 [Streptomyces sp. NPDC056835]|uniref:hypothetical protein n=1 Tax=Streptomyces sp. NPDC056835 TaxID=3345956 RepID=UPI00368B6F25